MRRYTPQVSVIIPTYNRAKLLPRALDSVFNQSFSDFEILLIDDGSTDETPVLIPQKYTDERLRYVRLEKNGGVASARNHGLALASGHYIAFLDSDDQWFPDKLVTQLQAIAATRHPERIVCFCSFVWQYGAGSKSKRLRKLRDGEALAEYLYCEFGAAQTSTLLLHQKIARAAKFEQTVAEDTGYLLHLESAGAEFLCVTEVLSHYFADDRPDQLATRHEMKKLSDWAETRIGSMRGKLGFHATVLAPMLADSGLVRNRLTAISKLCRGILFGRLSKEAIKQSALKVFLPKQVYQNLRSLFAGWRRWRAA